MNLFSKKLDFADFAQELIDSRPINQWIDKKIQKAVEQLRGGADGDQLQFGERRPVEIALPRIEVREVEKTVYVDKPIYIDKPVDRVVEKAVCPAWALSLESYVALLPTIRAHAALSKLILGESAHDDSVALLHWLTRSGQWSTLEQVWQILAVQVQQQNSAASAPEQEILEASVALYNYSVSRGAASLTQPNIGQRYNYEQHTRVNHDGESVAAVLLPGLSNNQGKLVHYPLLHTH